MTFFAIEKLYKRRRQRQQSWQDIVKIAMWYFCFHDLAAQHRIKNKYQRKGDGAKNSWHFQLLKINQISRSECHISYWVMSCISDKKIQSTSYSYIVIYAIFKSNRERCHCNAKNFNRFPNVNSFRLINRIGKRNKAEKKQPRQTLAVILFYVKIIL